MSAYRQQEYDFVARTKKIIEQYEEFELTNNEKYEVTLLVNCFVGLLILPQQHWFNNLPTELISEGNWGLRNGSISYLKAGEEKTVKQIVRHLRNSVSHYHFRMFDNSQNQISKIRFEDYAPNNGPKTFEAVITIDELNRFIQIFSQWFLDEMTRQNP